MSSDATSPAADAIDDELITFDEVLIGSSDEAAVDGLIVLEEEPAGTKNHMRSWLEWGGVIVGAVLVAVELTRFAGHGLL